VNRKIVFFLIFFHAGIVSASQHFPLDENEIINYIDNHKDEQLKLLERLVNINTGTENKEGVEQAGEIIKKELTKLGLKTRWDRLPEPMKHAGSLIATHHSEGKRILIIGHIDTVFPLDSNFQSFHLSSDHKTAIGPGVIDDKGGIVTIIYALKALHHIGMLERSNISIVLTGDEEQAEKPTKITRKALKKEAINSDIALGFEFSLTNNQLVTSRRGLSEWHLYSNGKSGHSSKIFHMESGYGAIYEAARILNDFSTQLSNIHGLTINPGIILGGQYVNENTTTNNGIAKGQKNIISSQALIHGDLRFTSNEQKNMAEQKMYEIAEKSLPLTSSNLIFNNIMPVMEESEGNINLLREFSDINQDLGGCNLYPVPVNERGGADISYISQYVSASIDGLGPWGEGPHTHNESLNIDSLYHSTKRAAIFINRYIKKSMN
jgi:glutamate carboxypeptidase